ncbi:hypothetical protein D9757_004004 [Collybiopsis confluens]|uniref:Zn(2)-C6 fungal-type domain-containing protein n=1 Tax=Collybiopsis confluens TaxID=2823264 RepID=A0A8H5HX77_9AGAR|nr:hypothetical protein D9757_004004 [Collybiopsis confluens]
MNPISSGSSSTTHAASKGPASKKAGRGDKTEKSNKKVSRACNTCRLKRKKCDGLDPCYFCRETKVECSYSREPRRRGPPSGYLKYTETRVNILETLLGLLCASHSNPDSIIPTLLALTLTLKSESKTCTQDVWDRHKANWSGSQAAEVIEELTLTFAPFVHNRGENSASGEGYAKPLLPPMHDGNNKTKGDDRSLSPPVHETHIPHTDRDMISLSPQSPHQHAPHSPLTATFGVTPNSQQEQPAPFSPGMLLRESFERTSSARAPSLDSATDRPTSVNSHHGIDRDHDAGHTSSLSFGYSFIDQSVPGSSSISYPTTVYHSRPQPSSSSSQLETGYLRSNPGVNPLELSEDSSYTGSYWRSAALALEDLPSFNVLESLSQATTIGLSTTPGRRPKSAAFSLLTPSDPISANHDLASSFFSTVSPSTDQIDLPPSHILSHLLDVYYAHIHPTFPVLSERSSIDSVLHAARSGSLNLADTALGNFRFGKTSEGLDSLGETTTCMLLSMCAYAGRLSFHTDVSTADSSEPSIDAVMGSRGHPTTRSFDSAGGATEPNIFLGSYPARIAADLWYEQARSATNALLRKPPKLGTVQALILLALRDYGKGGVAGGGESQALLLIGMAIRVAQELDLPISASYSPYFVSLNLPTAAPSSSAHSKIREKYTSEDHILRGNLWGILSILDGFLCLQLGRLPAVAEALKPVPNANPHQHIMNNANPALSAPQSPPSLFAYSYSLFRLMSKIHFWMYLGYGPNRQGASLISSTLPGISLATEMSENSLQAKLATLRVELDNWLQGLPIQFRVSIGGLGFGGTGVVAKEVLEINMYYHVAVILLYRPFVKDRSVQQVTDIFLDAASTFNLLLEKYKNQYASSPAAAAAPLSLSNPHLVYLIFTAALAHLSGYKARLQQARFGPNPVGIHPSQHSLPHHRATSPLPRNASSLSTASLLPLTPQQQTQQLQTQLHLMNCLDALKAIGKTWELARRCWRTLDQLMDNEGMKVGGISVKPPREQEQDSTSMNVSPQSTGQTSNLSMASPTSESRKRKREGYEGDRRSRTSSGPWPGVGGSVARPQPRAGPSPSNTLLGSKSAASSENTHGMTLAENPGILEPTDVTQGLAAPSAYLDSGMMDWGTPSTKSDVHAERSQYQPSMFSGSASNFDNLSLLSNRWLSEFFDPESFGDGLGAFDAEPLPLSSGGWGLAPAGIGSWDEWRDADWDKVLWTGKGDAARLDSG